MAYQNAVERLSVLFTQDICWQLESDAAVMSRQNTKAGEDAFQPRVEAGALLTVLDNRTGKKSTVSWRGRGRFSGFIFS